MVANTLWFWGVPKCNVFVSLPLSIQGLPHGNGETKWLIIRNKWSRTPDGNGLEIG